MSQQEILEEIIKKMPNPNLVSDLDLTSEYDSVRFSWNGYKFRVTSSGFVEEVEGGLLSTSPIATLLRAVLFDRK